MVYPVELEETAERIKREEAERQQQEQREVPMHALSNHKLLSIMAENIVSIRKWITFFGVLTVAELIAEFIVCCIIFSKLK